MFFFFKIFIKVSIFHYFFANPYITYKLYTRNRYKIQLSMTRRLNILNEGVFTFMRQHGNHIYARNRSNTIIWPLLTFLTHKFDYEISCLWQHQKRHQIDFFFIELFFLVNNFEGKRKNRKPWVFGISKDIMNSNPIRNVAYRKYTRSFITLYQSTHICLTYSAKLETRYNLNSPTTIVNDEIHLKTYFIRFSVHKLMIIS